MASWKKDFANSSAGAALVGPLAVSMPPSGPSRGIPVTEPVWFAFLDRHVTTGEPMTYLLEREQIVSSPRSAVFAFFADASNLERMTPRSLRFHILTALPLDMRAGALIDYQLTLFGLRFKWQTVIELFEPGVRFIDVQKKGPYKVWRHTHEFVDVEGGTKVRDRVEYEMPFGPLGTVVRALFVESQLRRIFDFRARVMSQRFGAPTTP